VKDALSNDNLCPSSVTTVCMCVVSIDHQRLTCTDYYLFVDADLEGFAPKCYRYEGNNLQPGDRVYCLDPSGLCNWLDGIICYQHHSRVYIMFTEIAASHRLQRTLMNHVCEINLSTCVQ